MKVVAMLVLAVLVIGCSNPDAPMPDSGIMPIDRPPDVAAGTICYAYGEACKTDHPAATLCHDDKGWCINDVCRPQCTSATRICDALVHRVDPESSAGYCEPR